MASERTGASVGCLRSRAAGRRVLAAAAPRKTQRRRGGQPAHKPTALPERTSDRQTKGRPTDAGAALANAPGAAAAVRLGVGDVARPGVGVARSPPRALAGGRARHAGADAWMAFGVGVWGLVGLVCGLLGVVVALGLLGVGPAALPLPGRTSNPSAPLTNSPSPTATGVAAETQTGSWTALPPSLKALVVSL
jgi:hypothetical protein